MDDVRDADVLGAFWVSFDADVVLVVFRVPRLASLRLKQTEGSNDSVWTRAQNSLVLLVLNRLDRRMCACVRAYVRVCICERARVSESVHVGLCMSMSACMLERCVCVRMHWCVCLLSFGYPDSVRWHHLIAPQHFSA